MILKEVQKKVMTSTATLPVVILICAIAWGWYLFSCSSAVSVPDQSFLAKGWGIKISSRIGYLYSFVMYVIAGYMLLELNNRSDILRIKGSVLAAVYCLFITFCPELYSFTFSNLSLLAFLLSLFFLLSSYQCYKSSSYLFHSFAVLGVGTLFFPPLVYFVFIWLLGAGMLRSLNWRSFFGALIGFSFPYWILLAYALYIDRMDIFYIPFIGMANFGEIGVFGRIGILNLLSLSFFFILFCASIFHCLAIDYDNKIRTRVILHFVIILNMCLFTFIILQPAYEIQFLNLLIPGMCLLICHLFVRSHSRFSYYLFISAIIFIIVLYLLKVIYIY